VEIKSHLAILFDRFLTSDVLDTTSSIKLTNRASYLGNQREREVYQRLVAISTSYICLIKLRRLVPTPVISTAIYIVDNT